MRDEAGGCIPFLSPGPSWAPGSSSQTLASPPWRTRPRQHEREPQRASSSSPTASPSGKIRGPPGECPPRANPPAPKWSSVSPASASRASSRRSASPVGWGICGPNMGPVGDTPARRRRAPAPRPDRRARAARGPVPHREVAVDVARELTRRRRAREPPVEAARLHRRREELALESAPAAPGTLRGATPRRARNCRRRARSAARRSSSAPRRG
jgi:hypothetical protein